MRYAQEHRIKSSEAIFSGYIFNTKVSALIKHFKLMVIKNNWRHKESI